MNSKNKIDFIVNWINNYTKSIRKQPVALIIGVSGGVDSALTSTLCALTGLKTIAISMPIKQNSSQHDLSLRHLDYLKNNFNNVNTKIINLDEKWTVQKIIDIVRTGKDVGFSYADISNAAKLKKISEEDFLKKYSSYFWARIESAREQGYIINKFIGKCPPSRGEQINMKTEKILSTAKLSIYHLNYSDNNSDNDSDNDSLNSWNSWST